MTSSQALENLPNKIPAHKEISQDEIEQIRQKQMIKTLMQRLSERPITLQELLFMLDSSDELEIELLKSQGLPLESSENIYFLSTNVTPISKQRFCFVDLETTGARPKEAQIIEIGAIMYENGEIIDRFEEFIYAPFVPQNITEITSINADMLKNARKMRAVLDDFRLFLGDSIFVAHNAGFDYNFLDSAFMECNLGMLLNQKICTIELAKKTILSPRYSLKYLNELLGINTKISHRAYADALTALKIFEIALLCLPKGVRTGNDLIRFANPSRQFKSKHASRI